MRVDSGHDDAKFTDACIENGVKFIVKRNHRRETYADLIADMRENITPVESAHGNHRLYFQCKKDIIPANAKKYDLYAAFKLKESFSKNSLFAYMSKKDQPCELISYWTNIDIVNVAGEHFGFTTAMECDRLYAEHATSEQFHSELKSDMNIELLPSKYFATNKLFLHLAAVSFNVLRIIGDEGVNNDQKFQHHKNERTTRIRLRTVIDKICTIAFKLVRHARRIFIKFGRKVIFDDTFIKIYKTTS